MIATRRVIGEFEGITFDGNGDKCFSEDVEGVQLYEPRRGADDATVGLRLFTTMGTDHLIQCSEAGVEMHPDDAVEMALAILRARAPERLESRERPDVPHD